MTIGALGACGAAECPSTTSAHTAAAIFTPPRPKSVPPAAAILACGVSLSATRVGGTCRISSGNSTASRAPRGRVIGSQPPGAPVSSPAGTVSQDARMTRRPRGRVGNNPPPPRCAHARRSRTTLKEPAESATRRTPPTRAAGGAGAPVSGPKRRYFYYPNLPRVCTIYIIWVVIQHIHSNILFFFSCDSYLIRLPIIFYISYI
jgi:hypothetical protein